jgi:hypothetical protein
MAAGATASPLPKGVRFAVSLAILGMMFFLLPPQVAGLLAIILVLGALVGSGANPAAPIKAFSDLVYGG